MRAAGGWTTAWTGQGCVMWAVWGPGGALLWDIDSTAGHLLNGHANPVCLPVV